MASLAPEEYRRAVKGELGQRQERNGGGAGRVVSRVVWDPPRVLGRLVLVPARGWFAGQVSRLADPASHR